MIVDAPGVGGDALGVADFWIRRARTVTESVSVPASDCWFAVALAKVAATVEVLTTATPFTPWPAGPPTPGPPFGWACGNEPFTTTVRVVFAGTVV